MSYKKPQIEINTNRIKPNMNLKTIYTKFIKDVRAASPVVGSLILISVSVIGAASMGPMTTHLANDVEERGMTEDISISHLIIGGGATVQPLVEQLTEKYMEVNPNVIVIVQGGKSSTSIAAVSKDIVDIGITSRAIKTTELANAPKLQTFKIGRKEVVVIANNATHLNIHREDLIKAFRDNYFTTNLVNAGINKAIQRLDKSSTEYTFANALGGIDIHRDIEGKMSNVDIISYIAANPGTIGFVDSGFAINDRNTFTDSEIDGLTDVCFDRSLNMITYGAPSDLERSFLDFVRQSNQRGIFEKNGVKSLYC